MSPADSEADFFLVPGNGLLGIYDRGGSGVMSLAQAISGENGVTAYRGTGWLQVITTGGKWVLMV